MTECPTCGVSQSFRTRDVSEYVRGEVTYEYRMVQCGGCESSHAIPLQSAPSEHYNHEVPRWRWEFGELAGELKVRFPKGARVLEVGCHEGYCLKHLQDAGHQVEGIDFNTKAIATAQAKGLNCRVATIEQVHPTQKFDCLYFFHVLEHVEDPHDFLQSSASLVKDDGLLALSVPHPDRIMLSCGRDTWDFPPNHLHRYSIKGLQQLLNRAGFQVLQIVSHPKDMNLRTYVSFYVYHLLSKVGLGKLYEPAQPGYTFLPKLVVACLLFPHIAIKYLLNRHRPGLAVLIFAQPLRDNSN